MALAWKEVLAPLTSPLSILAHSNGGPCTHALLAAQAGALLPRLACIALTDAGWGGLLPPAAAAWAASSPGGSPAVVNWTASKKPLGTALPARGSGIARRSAGHEKHVWTTASARGEFWPWLRAHAARLLPPETDVTLPDSQEVPPE